MTGLQVLSRAGTSACVLKFTVFVNVTGRIPQLDHRSISQYKTSIPPCVCRIVQHVQEMYTSLYCSTDPYDDVRMTQDPDQIENSTGTNQEGRVQSADEKFQ